MYHDMPLSDRVRFYRPISIKVAINESTLDMCRELSDFESSTRRSCWKLDMAD